jgi:3-methylcrotonyl-CoA carboxylase alpha subunit
MDAALAQTHIVGLNTNVQFLRHVVASDAFAQARLDTALIAREAASLFEQEKVGLAWAGAALVADSLHHESAATAALGGWKDPWAARDAWQSHAAPVRTFALEFAGATHTATLRLARDGTAQLECGGVHAKLNYTVQADGSMDMEWGIERQRLQVYRQGETAHVFMAHGATQIVAVDALAHAAVAQTDTGRLTAPMPGKLLSFAVKAGDTVRRGQPLAVMDAMKMEHTISAPADGTVQELLYAPGDQVAEGAELLRLAVAVAA